MEPRLAVAPLGRLRLGWLDAAGFRTAGRAAPPHRLLALARQAPAPRHLRLLARGAVTDVRMNHVAAA